jgi:hypothetical protein
VERPPISIRNNTKLLSASLSRTSTRLTFLNHAKGLESEIHLSDLESAKITLESEIKAEEDILGPLQFLLAARRGVHQDPSFASIHVPDDRAITFQGPSGVKPAVDRSSRWSRFVRHIGYLPTR